MQNESFSRKMKAHDISKDEVRSEPELNQQNSRTSNHLNLHRDLIVIWKKNVQRKTDKCCCWAF